VRFRAIIDFLQDNGLTAQTILRQDDPVDDEISIHTDALTEKGRLIMEKCYHKWLKKIDRGLNPRDMSIFDNELKRL
jgi:hypothetical protein